MTQNGIPGEYGSVDLRPAPLSHQPPPHQHDPEEINATPDP